MYGFLLAEQAFFLLDGIVDPCFARADQRPVGPIPLAHQQSIRSLRHPCVNRIGNQSDVVQPVTVSVICLVLLAGV
ncbi:hypothetical protein D3C81_1784810 [compost metagenome]